MTRFRKAAVTCPCCRKKYMVEIIFSTIWSGDISTDLLRYTMGKMPINYLVHTCPECGWSGKGEFPDPEPEEIRLFIRERITPVMGGGPVPPWNRWEFFAWIREAAGAADLELGETFLLASQCARLGGRGEEEERLRRRSIELLEKALEKKEVPEDSLFKTTYLVGELYRRSGDGWKAKEWFEKTMKLNIDHETKDFFQDLARRQMEEPGDLIGDDRKEEKQMIKDGAFSGILARLFPWKRKN